MIEKRQFYIDGAWVDPISGTDCDVIDPSTEEAVAVISLGGQADTDAAVAAARAALPAWRAKSHEERIGYVPPAEKTGCKNNKQDEQLTQHNLRSEPLNWV